MSRLATLDPGWAWDEFHPSAEMPWDRRCAAHLYRRAGFAATAAELDRAVAGAPGEVIEELLDVSAESDAFRQSVDALNRASLATGNVKSLSAAWAYRMLHTPVPLLEKLTLFWHGHFATSGEKVQDAELMLEQNELLRKYALGDFSRLLLEISRDPAMLIYLDSATNRKAHPNENFAREIMELFCLGEGNYSEDDIRELARCFTGWEVKRKKFRFNRYQHDTGSKTLLGQTGAFSGEQAVDVVASQESAPRFIAAKLVRFFVTDDPAPPVELIDPLASCLREHDFQIAPVVRRILSSNLFFSPIVRARKVRSPVELAIGFLRALEGTTDAYRLSDALEQLGQGLFYPPSVKGWDGGKTWINSSTLVGRSNLIGSLLSDEKTRFGKLSLSQYLASQAVTTPTDLLDFLETTLFAVEVGPSARQQVIELYRRGGNRDEQIKQAVHLLCTLPEFQLA